MQKVDFDKHFQCNKRFLILKISEYLSEYGQSLYYEHHSNCHQLLLIENSNGTVIIDQTKYTLTENNLLTISKGQLQKLKINSAFNGYILLFNDKALKRDNYKFYLSLNYFFFEFALKPVSQKISLNDFEELLEIFDLLNNDIYASGSMLGNNIQDSLLLKLLQKTVDIKSDQNHVIKDNDRSVLKSFHQELGDNIHNSRSVSFYADTLAVSTKKLNCVTKKILGRTAKEFIEERIIYDSKKLLLDTSDTIKQISFAMGFADPTNFNKFFKKITNTTPLQFRDQFNKSSF